MERTLHTPARGPHEDLPSGLFVAMAVALPFAFWAVHASLGHEGDIAFFHEWYLAFRQGSSLYRDGPGLNYPIVGVLLVCGPSALVELARGEVLSLATFRVVLKATLVVGEVLFVLVASGLARALSVRRPRAAALALYALPSTWAAGAFFGQIDVFGTVLLMASAWALLVCRRDADPRALVLGSLSLSLALLSKQLTWFSAPALLLLLAYGMREVSRRPGARAGGWLRPAVLAALPFLLLVIADPFLALPDGARAHLWHVLVGSRHGDLAVASGASLWSLGVVGGTPAADVRFLDVGSFFWGWLGFAVAELAFVALVLRRRSDTRALVRFAGYSQLAMATLLTGVHERYLVHAIPLLLLCDADGPRWRIGLGALVGLLSGVFVVSTMYDEGFVGPLYLLSRPEPVAVLTFAWLATHLIPWREHPSDVLSATPALAREPVAEKAAQEHAAQKSG